MPVKAPQLVFCRNESVSAGLRRIVDELIKSAIACIKEPSTEREEDLHQVRLAIKIPGETEREAKKQSIALGKILFDDKPGHWMKALRKRWEDWQSSGIPSNPLLREKPA